MYDVRDETHTLKFHLQCALCFLFFAFASYLFTSLYSFIDNCVSYHIFLVTCFPSRVRQLLSLATENNAQRGKKVRGKSKKQEAKSTL